MFGTNAAKKPQVAPMFGASADYLKRLGEAIADLDEDALDRAIALVEDAWRRDAQIITLGNGGSALTALHMVTDWTKGVFMKTGRPFRGRSLVENMGLFAAYANDTSYADVFAEQLKGVMRPGDLVIAISGSGNSENVIRAVQHANANGATTLGLCGFGGGRLKDVAHHVVWAAVDDMQICEDVHAIFGHIVMQALSSR